MDESRREQRVNVPPFGVLEGLDRPQRLLVLAFVQQQQGELRRAAGVGRTDTKLQIRHTSWASPWLPPLASAATGPSSEPARPSHTEPSGATKNW